MALDAYLELLEKSIKGEALDKRFRSRGAIELISFELKSQQDLGSESVTATGDSQADFFTFSITKAVDAATPVLYQMFCQRICGSPTDANKAVWNTARVTLRRASGSAKQPVNFAAFEFEDVYIKDWSLDSKDGEDLPEEDIEFCFKVVTVRYWPQSTGGNVAALKECGWDFGENQAEVELTKKTGMAAQIAQYRR